jgi:hypothetical protein
VQRPFFYGWLIVAIVMIAGVLAAGVSNITMAVVLKPISEDLGWSRTFALAPITPMGDTWPMTKSCQPILAMLNCPV